MSDVEIRVARVEDQEALRGLLSAFRDHLGAAVPTDADFARQLPEALGDAATEFACAWVDGRAVGYTLTRFFRSVWVSGLEAQLDDLFVLPAARGRAIGRELLRHAVARAQARSARRLGLNTNERNTAAQRLYRAAGFLPQSSKLWGDGREIFWVLPLDEG